MSNDLLEILVVGDIEVVDSRLIALELGISHAQFYRTIKDNQTDIEEAFGSILWETETRKRDIGAVVEKFAYLNANQATYLINKSRSGISQKFVEDCGKQNFNLSNAKVVDKNNLKRKHQKESIYVKKLAQKTEGKREVKTLAGKIDILTNTQIIEVKHISMWKHAIGQILVYSYYYPSHQKRIHLYGETQESFLKMVKEHCDQFDIFLTWEA